MGFPFSVNSLTEEYYFYISSASNCCVVMRTQSGDGGRLMLDLPHTNLFVPIKVIPSIKTDISHRLTPMAVFWRGGGGSVDQRKLTCCDFEEFVIVFLRKNNEKNSLPSHPLLHPLIEKYNLALLTPEARVYSHPWGKMQDYSFFLWKKNYIVYINSRKRQCQEWYCSIGPL